MPTIDGSHVETVNVQRNFCSVCVKKKIISRRSAKDIRINNAYTHVYMFHTSTGVLGLYDCNGYVLAFDDDDCWQNILSNMILVFYRPTTGHLHLCDVLCEHVATNAFDNDDDDNDADEDYDDGTGNYVVK